MKVKDIKANNNVTLIVLINRVIQGIASNGTNYLNLSLQDNTGVISARIWDANKDDINNLKANQVIQLEANSLNYNNEIQLKINKYKFVADSSKYLDLLLKKAPINIENACDEIIKTINSFTNPILKSLLNYFFDNSKIEIFKNQPAAIKMHHAVQGGLLWHTVTMLRLAKQIVVIYQDRNINQDLLFAGVIMHDYGKMIELDTNHISTYTLAGKMLGHISIACAQISLACGFLKINDQEEIVLLLQHLVLASHGKYEFGSPVLPKVLEAEILHQLDNLDAKIFVIDEGLGQVEIGENTNRLMGLENRIFYKHQKN